MKRPKLRLFLALCSVITLVLISSFWWIPLPERLVHADSQTVLWSDRSLAHTFLSPDERWRLAGDPSRLDPAYLQALFFIEDERFESHFGVDPIAIVRAAMTNWSSGRIVSGASTLTMQLARLLEPRPRRLSSKIIEAWRALQLHLRLGRQEVLANYLRFLPFGGNLEGVHGASYAYFNHSAATLDAAEIATLLAVPQRPGARAPSLINGTRLRSARDTILRRMRQGELIDQSKLEESLAEPVPEFRRAMPRSLPHAARWLRAQRPFKTEIHSTLDASAQRLAQEVFDRNASERAKLDIQNGAIVVVDHQTQQIKALIGGADFFADHDGAQIPAFDRPRHAASTLKPILLGLAIDEGIASPEHLVQDLPTHYGSYRPQNFSGTFQGLVRLDEALTQSLNVPFVRLLSRLGIEQFIGLLRNLGLQHVNPKPEFYGLAAALGTVPVTLIELAEMYAGLAGDGRVRTLRRFADDPASDGIKMVTAEAAWRLRQVLKTRDRPDFPIRARLYGMAPQIHWKTGTSFGFRDAWSVGSDEQYTVAVWLGNLNRNASRYLVGAPIAGPLLFDAFDALGHQDSDRLEDQAPAGMMKTQVCAFSGFLPGAGCDETQTVDAPRQSIAIAECPYHRKLYVADRGQEAYPKACAPKGAVEKSVLILPSQTRAFTHLMLPQVYTLSADCQTRQRSRLRVVSPSQKTLILIPGMDTKEQEIALQAEAEEGAELSWFINGKFLGSKTANEPLWWQPSLGEHTIVVSDSTGRSTRKTVTVRAH